MPPVEMINHLAAIVESSDDAIYSKSLDGIILTWNAAAEKLYGYSADEMVGKSVSSLLPGDRPQELEDILVRVRRGERVDHFESIRVRKDGTVMPMSLTISPVLDASGNLIAASTIARDITERKLSEATLATPPNRALVASKAKSELLAPMRHDLRTPMNGVRGLNGPLLDTDLTETQRDDAQRVRASAEELLAEELVAEELLALFSDILDFADLDAGRLEIEVVDFNLAQVVHEVADLVAEAARAKGVEVVAECNPDVPLAVRGDGGRLRQILHNFAITAIKFSEASDVAIIAGLAEEPTAEEVVVRFEVVDTGIGIDPATAQRLFDPFSQSDASAGRRDQGTGLGLAVCLRLAEALGGAVGVESRPGEGSTFWLRLPLAYASV